jgi:hypothetical protein
LISSSQSGSDFALGKAAWISVVRLAILKRPDRIELAGSDAYPILAQRQKEK